MQERPRWWTLVLRGLAMGAADVVPGISGGTMALVLGVYERLISALRALTSLEPWRQLAHGRVRAAWQAAHAPFLAPLLVGIAGAVLVLSRFIVQALESYHVPLYASFAGLMLAAAVLVARRVVRWRASTAVSLVAAALATTLLLGGAPVSAPNTFWTLFVAGALGITALVLPGVSGAFILVLLGQYDRVMNAIAGLDVAALLPFALGAVAGLASVARLLHLMLRRAPDVTMAALLGVMIASLRRAWPWTSGDAYRDSLVWPVSAWGVEGWLPALLFAAGAFAGVLALERAAGGRIVARDVSSTS